jgi:hypothetical protein
LPDQLALVERGPERSEGPREGLVYPAPRMKQTFALTLLLLALPLAAEPLTLLDANGTILRFIDTANPAFAYRSVSITGLQPNETIGAIDYRPSNGLLYGIGVLASGPARLYTLNTTTGQATLVGSGPFHSFIGASPIGMDFNPVVDRIRLISNTDLNVRVNPNDGTAIVDTSVAFSPGDPNQNNNNSPLSLAYTNNVAGATSTTLYGIVSGNGPFLVTVGSPGGSPVSPNSGVMFTVGQTGLGGYFSLQQSMDISGRTGIAYMVVDNNDILYSVNLSTGHATAIGPFPNGSAIMGIAASGGPDVHPRHRAVRH